MHYLAHSWVLLSFMLMWYQIHLFHPLLTSTFTCLFIFLISWHHHSCQVHKWSWAVIPHSPPYLICSVYNCVWFISSLDWFSSYYIIFLLKMKRNPSPSHSSFWSVVPRQAPSWTTVSTPLWPHNLPYRYPHYHTLLFSSQISFDKEEHISHVQWYDYRSLLISTSQPHFPVPHYILLIIYQWYFHILIFDIFGIQNVSRSIFTWRKRFWVLVFLLDKP